MAHPASPPPRKAAFRGYGAEAGGTFLVLVLAAAVFVPTWLLGGFQRADLPEIGVAETAVSDEVAITIVSAELREVRDGADTSRLLIVETHVVNRLLDEDVGRFHELVVLGEPVFAKPTLPLPRLAGELTHGQTIQPELPRDVWLVWGVPPNVQVPDEITLTLRKRTYERDFGAQPYRWKDPKPWLTARVPVERG